MMTTTDTRPVVHQPWCNHHVVCNDNEQWCEREVRAAGAIVNVEADAEKDGALIGLWAGEGPHDEHLTPAQARVIAAALIEAAEIVENA